MKQNQSFYIGIFLLVFTLPIFAGTSNMDFEKIYTQNCLKCHGAIHQGGVGHDLRPKSLRKTSSTLLTQIIVDGKKNTAMSSWGHIFSKDDALGMIEWLLHWSNDEKLLLSLNNIHKTWTKLADLTELATKYPNPTDVKDVRDITFVTERDASLVDFIDSTSGKVLSRHKAGYAVHVTISNKHNPRYAYSISRSGKLTMFDIASPGQPALATVQVGEDSRGLAVSADGKYLLVGNYLPSGAVLCDAMTLEPLQIYSTDRVLNTEGKMISSRVSGITDTPFGPYFAMGLKDAGRVYIIDYSKTDFPIVADIGNIAKNLHDAFLNSDKGEDYGRYFQIASQGSDVTAIIDFKTKKLVKRVVNGRKFKPHPGEGASWFNKSSGKQLNATNSMNFGMLVVWSSNEWEFVKKIETAGGGLFISTSDQTPWVWSDCVLGKPEQYNKIYLTNKETLQVDKIIEVDRKEGRLIDAKTKKVLQAWDATQYERMLVAEKKFRNETILPMPDKLGSIKKNPVQPRLLHPEPVNYGKWTMVSEWTTGRIGLYDSKTGEFIKYIQNLTTPTFSYSVGHRIKLPGA